MPLPSSGAAPRLRLRVKRGAEAHVRQGHPWVYANSVQQQNRAGHLGELGIVYDAHDRFLAIGLYDPTSPICLRVLHAGQPQALDERWWTRRFDAAIDAREGLFDERTNGYRLINGESDGWPGLVLDRYAYTLVLKVYAGAWLPRWADVLALIAERFPRERLVVRLSRNLRDVAAEFGVHDGSVVRGDPLLGPVVFREAGVAFEADVLRGQKTGFFLDQRENRARVEELSRGKRVLNAFSFSGGFSLYAARGGATSVTSVDISAHALASAERNFALNADTPAVAACEHITVRADVFSWLHQHHARPFDLIVLDPPSLAKRETERAGAIRQYEHLVMDALNLLASEGVLLAASCSAHVSADEFTDAVMRAAYRSGRTVRVLRTSGHAADHPATFQEARYLKAVYLKCQ
ncbi:class I SAM-dependent methyltransferase [Deinococcus yavapaiensis]|uniref:class I SAM-dependent methyltransferase n=1 Tax=Deinococcus yavapaiensis TaxID=309889 RepID=UPI001FE2C3DE|nr:class I SAM-dependent methyltransferase [Deinococcus yavapaiensis]